MLLAQPGRYGAARAAADEPGQVTMLIKKGVNIGIVDKSGRMAEQQAELKGHRELVKWLTTGAFPKCPPPGRGSARAQVGEPAPDEVGRPA